ncbi:MAG: NUDIX domain-containing protein [Pedobacter sp.]|nr:MAG: NUDIX domain-containing protein [Pedobacter sp.]
MAQNYRIYINDNTLFIADTMPNQTLEFQQLETEGFDFLTFYKNLKKIKGKNYLLITDDAKETFKSIKRKLTVIKAAGGLVTNANGEYLFIFRNKKWDLPKGKVEKKEKIKIAAVREVEEECGVTIESRDQLLCKTYHMYELGNKVILKRTNWYKMTVKGLPALVPQVEEGITEAVWVAPTLVSEKMKNTYPLILDVLEADHLI